jgi:DNA-binding beta-propeller fold protein YncE
VKAQVFAVTLTLLLSLVVVSYPGEGRAAAQGTATPTPKATSRLWFTPSPTATPAPTPTSTPLPPPDPSSRLPRPILDVDLGLPEGNAYEPTDFLLDSRAERLHVFSNRFEERSASNLTPGTGRAGGSQQGKAVSVLDVTWDRLFHTFALPLPEARPLIATGEWIYLCHPGPDKKYKLSALGSTLRQVAATISLEGATGCHDFDLKPDFGGERIYLAFADRLEVRTAATLYQLDSLTFDEPRPALKIAVHPSRRWIYLYSAERLEVRGTGNLTKSVATIPLETPLEPHDLILEATERQRYLSPPDLVATATAVAAGGDVEAGRLYLHQGDHVDVRKADTLELIATISDERLAKAGELIFDAATGQLYARAARELLTINTVSGRVVSAIKVEEVDRWYLLDADGPAGIAYIVTYLSNARHIKALKAATGEIVAESPLSMADKVAPDLKRDKIYVVQTEKHRVLYLNAGDLSPRQKIPLGIELTDLASDPQAGRLYVADNAGRVHVVDSSSGVVLKTLAGEGKLYLDRRNKRLYVSEDGATQTQVIDTENLAQLQDLPTGGIIALDSQRNRIYIGRRAWLPPYAEDEGVAVYDGETLQQIGLIAQPGRPVFNPLTNEVYIVAYTAYIADGETWGVTGELTPQIGEQEQKGLSGCSYVSRVTVYPDPGVVAVTYDTVIVGHSSGIDYPPAFLDARTHEPLPYTFTPLQSCGAEPLLAGPIGGQAYGFVVSERYEVLGYNMVAYGPEGEPVSYVDGIAEALIDPGAGLAYIPCSYNTLLLDLEKLVPVGYLPYNFHCGDFSSGLLYSISGPLLRAFEHKGGRRAQPAPPEPSNLPVQELGETYPSPDYQDDQTVFALLRDDRWPGIYRSTDGGASWERLAGGLPEPPTRLVISSNYAHDHTLFVTFDSRYKGTGVYRSTDGGDTWWPMWNGLKHLRVYRLVLSPDYAEDRTILAYARYEDIMGIEEVQGKYSVFRTDDGGESWKLVTLQDEGTHYMGD